MADLRHISATPPLPEGRPPRGYRQAGEVVRRAAVIEGGESPEVGGALRRLRAVLHRGEPLRTDVPRGYYLNIRV